LYNAAKPETDSLKVLVVAYWVQMIMHDETWGSQAVNKMLKDLGRGCSNITTSLKALMDRKPNLVMQTRKDGSTKQARKLYKLTTEGIEEVKRMIQPKRSTNENDTNF
jgi:hypothetical protein